MKPRSAPTRRNQRMKEEDNIKAEDNKFVIKKETKLSKTRLHEKLGPDNLAVNGSSRNKRVKQEEDDDERKPVMKKGTKPSKAEVHPNHEEDSSSRNIRVKQEVKLDEDDKPAIKKGTKSSKMGVSPNLVEDNIPARSSSRNQRGKQEVDEDDEPVMKKRTKAIKTKLIEKLEPDNLAVNGSSRSKGMKKEVKLDEDNNYLTKKGTKRSKDETLANLEEDNMAAKSSSRSKRVKKELKLDEDDKLVLKKGSKPSKAELLANLEADYLAVNGSAKLTVGLHRLQEQFFDAPCEQLAKVLLGKVLVRRREDGTLVRGRIVETECYPGGEDKASCTYNGKITEKTKGVFMKPGVMFVYLTYGMYHCVNISSQGEGAAVLLRAVEPLDGIEAMRQERAAVKKNKSAFKDHELCNGPAKLCLCFNITKKDCNLRDLCVWDNLWLEEDELSGRLEDRHIVTSTRIGIDSVGAKWANLPLRFYLYGYKSVSRVDKAKEQTLEGVVTVLS